MADSLTNDILKKSVTAGDVQHYMGAGVVNLFLPWFMIPPLRFGLPVELPIYWSYQRDAVLRSSTLFCNQWAQAAAIACTKVASQSFDVKGDIPRRVQQAKQMIVDWGGEGYVASQMRGVHDFLNTDSGEHIEIVRQSSAAGSKILGLVHLDSLRCTRTGDPETPVVYRDLRGEYHELRYWEVISLADQPDNGLTWHGIGHCAAERCYDRIYLMTALEIFIRQKVTGEGVTAIDLIRGINIDQLEDIKVTGQQEKIAKGLTYHQGHILSAAYTDQPLEHIQIALRGLPDGFDIEKERIFSNLNFANAIGLAVTDLQPLAHQGLGTGKQAEVLEEKQQGRGLVARNKMLLHKLDEWVMPDRVEFYFSEKDLREETTRAGIYLQHAQARAQDVANLVINQQQALHSAIDLGDYPNEWLPPEVAHTEGVKISDEEKGDTAEEAAPEETATEKEAAALDPVLNQYQDELDSAIKDFQDGKIKQDKFEDRLRDSLIAAALLIYSAGGDVDEANLTDEDRQRIDQWVSDQEAFIGGLATAAQQATGDAKAQAALTGRVELWVSSLATLGMLANGLAQSDAIGRWIYGDTVDHCGTCEMLAQGRPHRVSWYIENGYIPRENGSETLECGGWKCDCSVVDVKTGERLL